QENLGNETAELARAINGLMAELERNGFPPQSLGGLNELVSQLGTVGGDDMSAIAARLRKLGETADGDARGTVADAYVAQQAIENRLKNLAQQIAVRQLREQAVNRLEALITRQLATQRETRAVSALPDPADRQQ